MTGVSALSAFELTALFPGITMDPATNMRLDATVNFAKRMDGTSWWHPLRGQAKADFLQ
jgi:hypothetical protein